MVYLTKIDASRNMARFYALDLQPDLFGWLSAGQALGQDRPARPGPQRPP